MGSEREKYTEDQSVGFKTTTKHVYKGYIKITLSRMKIVPRVQCEGAYLLELLNSAEEDTHVALEAAHGEAGHSGGGLRTKAVERVNS